MIKLINDTYSSLGHGLSVVRQSLKKYQNGIYGVFIEWEVNRETAGRDVVQYKYPSHITPSSGSEGPGATVYLNDDTAQIDVIIHGLGDKYTYLTSKNLKYSIELYFIHCDWEKDSEIVD